MIRHFIAAALVVLLMASTGSATNINIDADSNDAVDIEYGGTNATTAAGARTNLALISVWNEISDADDAGTIDFGTYAQILQTAIDAVSGIGLIVEHTESAITNDIYLMEFRHTADGDAEAHWWAATDDGGDTVRIQAYVNSDGDAAVQSEVFESIRTDAHQSIKLYEKTSDGNDYFTINGAAITGSTTPSVTVPDFDAALSAATDVDSSGHNTEPGYLEDVPCTFCIALSDETTDLTTGTTKRTWRMPYAMTLTAVRASVNTAPTGAGIQIDLNEAGVSVFSTELTIDAGEETSEAVGTTAEVVSNPDIDDDAEMTADIVQVGSSTVGKGLKICLIGTRDY